MPLPPEGSPPVLPSTDDRTENLGPSSRNGHRPPRREGPGSHPQNRRTYLRRRIVAGLLLGLVILVADAAYASLRSGSLLTEAKVSFERAAAALADSDLINAREHLERGLERADRAANLTSHPGFAVVRLSPLGDDARATEVITDAVRLAARAGLVAIEGGLAMGADGGGIASSILQDGRVEFDLLEEGRPYLERAADLLDDAASQFNVELRPRLGAVDRALASTDLRVEGAEESVDRLVALIGSLPSLLAEDGSRHYLLAFQAPGEARGTGGIIGLLGVLRAEDGRLTLGDIRPYSELQPRPIKAVKGPEWFEKRYGPFFGLRQWPQVNLSPHFPTVSKILLRMYREATGRSLDGVIAMDPLALESMMGAVEPIRQRGFDALLTKSNIAEVLMKDAYTTFPTPDAQNAFLEGVVRKFWAEISQGSFESLSLVKGLGEAVTSEHFKMYSQEGKDARSLAALGADGDFTHAGPNLQMVWHNNVAANKVDFFLQRKILTTIRLHPGGMARVHTEILLDNMAPSRPSSPLLGPGINEDPVGLNRMYLNVLVAKGAERIRVSLNGERRQPFRAVEAGFPVIWEVIALRSHEQATVDVSYEIPNAIRTSPAESMFEFISLPQPTTHPASFAVALMLDPSFESFQVEEGNVIGESRVLTEGQLDSQRAIRLTIND